MPTAEPNAASETPPKLPDAAALAGASTATVVASLATDVENGLSTADVQTRRTTSGYNEVSQAASHPVRQLAAKFWGISAWMLELIIVMSAVLGKYADVVIVSALLVVNAAIGFFQERRATGVVEALRQRLQVNVKVLRDGKWTIVPAREIVPGDVIRLRGGDIVPADVKILAGNFTVDESSLTGESGDVDKAESALLSSGSLVRHGEGTVVACLTGASTYFGRTTQLVQDARPTLHIEAVIRTVVRWLFVIVAAVLGAVLAQSVMHSDPILTLIPLLLVLLMSAVPVALPVMFTVSMAVGARSLASRGVLVTRLSAAEDAATMDVLCVDKTGTLTVNRLRVNGVVRLGSVSEVGVLAAGALASEAANHDPIDDAFLAAHAERLPAADVSNVQRLSFTPFDASTRRTEAVVLLGGVRRRVMKGAVESIAAACQLDGARLAIVDAHVAEASRTGYRVLAVAQGPAEGVLEMIGIVTLADTVRTDAKPLINKLKSMGVAVKMLTGDALSVALETGRLVGLPDIHPAADLHAATTQNDGRAETDRADGYAQVYPADKFAVVKLLQRTGHVCGMTGDGVNDAPALRQAEVGIAVSTATDIAKSAASVVLIEPGLTNIVALVEQGRAIYQRLLTWIINKISRTVFKAAFVAVAYVATGQFVVSALTMLLLVFMTDFAKIALSTDRVKVSVVPETWKIGGFVVLGATLGLAMTAEALGALSYAWRNLDLATNARAQHSFCFLLLLYFAVFSVVSIRERQWFWRSAPSRTLLVALLADLLVGTAMPFLIRQDLVPLGARHTALLLLYAAICCLVVNDALKMAILRATRAMHRPAPPAARGAT